VRERGVVFCEGNFICYIRKGNPPTLVHTYSMELMSLMKDIAIVSLGGWYTFERTKLKGTYVI
jgi:hypothetical protein